MHIDNRLNEIVPSFGWYDIEMYLKVNTKLIFNFFKLVFNHSILESIGKINSSWVRLLSDIWDSSNILL